MAEASPASLLLYTAMVVALAVLMLGLSAVLGERTRATRATREPFESGIVSVGGARLRLSARFYLVAVFFVIFDLEAVFVFAWAVSARDASWPGFVEIAVFIGILLAALLWLARTGALDWGPRGRQPAAMRRRSVLPEYRLDGSREQAP